MEARLGLLGTWGREGEMVCVLLYDLWGPGLAVSVLATGGARSQVSRGRGLACCHPLLPSSLRGIVLTFPETCLQSPRTLGPREVLTTVDIDGGPGFVVSTEGLTSDAKLATSLHLL